MTVLKTEQQKIKVSSPALGNTGKCAALITPTNSKFGNHSLQIQLRAAEAFESFHYHTLLDRHVSLAKWHNHFVPTSY